MLLSEHRITTTPVGHSLGLSVIFAALPLITLFVLLGGLRMKAWLAGLISLAVALVIAIGIYSMPVDQALLSGTEGAAFGFFPIGWIVLNAIWVYNLTVATGHFDVLRRSFARVSPDMRIQAIIIAFCFGALMEALAGFGTPVAITVVMLMAMGLRPVHAASVSLIANTAPVAFGALATPIVTLASVASGANDDHRLTVDTLGAMVGRQTPVLAVVVPLILVAVVDGRRGLRQTWPVALVCGLSFGLAQYVASNFISVQLTDIIAALVSALAVVVMLQVWRPAESPDLQTEPSGRAPEPGGTGTGGASVPAATGGPAATAAAPDGPAGGVGTLPPRGKPARSAEPAMAAATTTGATAAVPEPRRPADARSSGVDAPVLPDTRPEIARAYAPYLIIIAVFSIANLGPVKDGLTHSPWTTRFNWPGLHVLSAAGKPVSSLVFVFNWLPTPGTLMVISGILTALVLRISPKRALRSYLQTYVDLRYAIFTIMAVLALAYVLNQSGQTNTLGSFLAQAGGVFVFLSSILGWLGVAVTGSDTSSNALFGALQVQTAAKAGLDPVLLAAANSAGGVLGKMVSPQNLAIAASAVGMAGQEGVIFRRVLLWSLVLLLLMCVLVALQGTPVLEWMVP